MCIGIPMQVIDCQPGYALCQHAGMQRQIDTMLVGDQVAGTWLLTFLDTAREVLSAEKATKIADALKAMDLAMQGDATIDHLFQDLVDREPELPEFLRQTLPK